MSQFFAYSWIGSYLRDEEVRLHYQERIQRICTRSVGVVEEVFDLAEGRLAEVRAAELRGKVARAEDVLEAQRLRRVRERAHDARVQCLDLLEARSEELALRRGALVDANAYEDLAEQREDARDVVQP